MKRNLTIAVEIIYGDEIDDFAEQTVLAVHHRHGRLRLRPLHHTYILCHKYVRRAYIETEHRPYTPLQAHAYM